MCLKLKPCVHPYDKSFHRKAYCLSFLLVLMEGQKLQRKKKKLVKMVAQKEEKKPTILVIALNWENEEDLDEGALVSP